MKTRKNTPFPFYGDLAGFLTKAWESGWLDEYSDEHFLIKAIESRIEDIEWSEQLIFNNSPSIYSPVKGDGEINYNLFSECFIVNLSARLRGLSEKFGEDKIKNFVENQLSAGKANYKPNVFFQALSEVEILSFCARHEWDNYVYEPALSKGGKNPEASFEKTLINRKNGKTSKIKVNVEVKTPQFPRINKDKRRVAIPGVLINKEGQDKLRSLCEENNIRFLLPRVTKLVEFINSAASKFQKPKEGEYNLLYINWSYSDFPSNGFLEAWSLLSNEANGILTHKKIGTSLPFREPVSEEAYEKITAVIVYTSSLDQLMFSSFHHAWQGSPTVGQRFRMLVLDEKLRCDELENKSDILFKITGMKPSKAEPKKWRLLINCNWRDETPIEEQEKDANFAHSCFSIINDNLLI